MEGQRAGAYELADIMGLIKTKGLLYCPFTHKSISSSEMFEADRANSVGGFQSMCDLVTCGGCEANHKTCMCALRPDAHWLRGFNLNNTQCQSDQYSRM